MQRRILAVLAACLFHAGSASAQENPQTPAGAAPGVTTTVLSRSATTATGQPLGVPDGPREVVFSASEIPAGGVLPMHRHPWPRYAYVERGRLRVTYEATGLVRELGPGETLIEAVDQWHEAQAVGAEPVRVIVIDQVPPGETNIVRR